MTGRVTFGDLAVSAGRHLEAPARQAPVTSWPSRAQAAAEAGELLAVLPRMLKTMVRCTTDIAAALADAQDEAPAGPWALAAAQARQAAQDAYRYLPREPSIDNAWPQRQLTSSLARNLDAAATAITVARDLLHTHFQTTADGIRNDRPEWAHVITSAPVQKALLADLARWSRHIATPTPPGHSPPDPSANTGRRSNSDPTQAPSPARSPPSTRRPAP
jgi:hypothetical protein